MKRVASPSFRSPVAHLKAYKSVTPDARFTATADDAVKLDWNEAAIPPSPVVRQRLAAFLATGRLNWYADPTAHVVRRKLARYTGRPVSNLQVFNGSDSALDHVARAFVAKGDHVLVCAPCYDNFRVFASATGAQVEAVLGPSPFRVNTRGLVARIRPDTRLVYIVNPNNPTGRLYGMAQIETILQALTGGVLVVDEAYFEFSGVTAAGLLDRHPHLVVTRSFSKAFGLAGLRCGYIIANPRVIGHVNRIRNGKDVNALAQVAAAAAIDDLDYMRAYVAAVRRSRAWLVRQLRARNYPVVTSPANFVLVKVASPADLLSRLRAKGIYIRDRSYLPQLDHYVRITVGTDEQCRRVIAALDAIEPDRVASRP